MSETFICRNCKKSMFIDLAKKGTITKKGAGKCKACHSEYVRNIQSRGRVEKKPHDYMECDSCDKYFYKYTPGRAGAYLDNRLPVTECPYCKSDDIYLIGK